jgi:hypothetical protein
VQTKLRGCGTVPYWIFERRPTGDPTKALQEMNVQRVRVQIPACNCRCAVRRGEQPSSQDRRLQVVKAIEGPVKCSSMACEDSGRGIEGANARQTLAAKQSDPINDVVTCTGWYDLVYRGGCLR